MHRRNRLRRTFPDGFEHHRFTKLFQSAAGYPRFISWRAIWTADRHGDALRETGSSLAAKRQPHVTLQIAKPLGSASGIQGIIETLGESFAISVMFSICSMT